MENQLILPRQPLPESFFNLKSVMNNQNSTLTEYTKIGDCLYKVLDCSSPRTLIVFIEDLKVISNPPGVLNNNNRYKSLFNCIYLKNAKYSNTCYLGVF